MSDSPTSTIRKLQQRIGELIVQLDLGKLEALQAVEEQRKKLSSVLDNLGQAASEATVQSLRRQLDELQVQFTSAKWRPGTFISTSARTSTPP